MLGDTDWNLWVMGVLHQYPAAAWRSQVLVGVRGLGSVRFTQRSQRHATFVHRVTAEDLNTETSMFQRSSLRRDRDERTFRTVATVA
jgi:hypothetical protein